MSIGTVFAVVIMNVMNAQRLQRHFIESNRALCVTDSYEDMI